MVDAPFRLDADARRVVHDAIVALADRRGWSLHALNVRTNHVHVLAACYPATGDQALVACKAAATAALRQAGLVGPERRIWTTGGSRRYVRDWEGLERAIVYVRDMQGEGI
jgi:REP element-mobilizing transposase RayT